MINHYYSPPVHFDAQYYPAFPPFLPKLNLVLIVYPSNNFQVQKQWNLQILSVELVHLDQEVKDHFDLMNLSLSLSCDDDGRYLRTMMIYDAGLDPGSSSNLG